MKLAIRLCVLGAFLSTGLVRGESYDIYVAPKGSAAYETAQSLDDGQLRFSERKIHKAFSQAAKLIADCSECEVNIRLAAGSYEGNKGSGLWQFPDVNNSSAIVRILGGYQPDYASRTPFQTPTQLIVGSSRSGPVLKFEGKKHALKEVIVSGLTIDVESGNRYDEETNSLLKGSSSSWPVLAFGYLTTDKLTISDNVFIGAPHSVGGPRIRAMSPSAEVVVANNLMINNVFTWVVAGGGGKHTTANYRFEANSFIMNWPFNPDPTTSNPGTVEIGNNYSSSLVSFNNNLFAYNAGGAIFPQWDESRGPPMVLRDNLFWGNGALFGVGDKADAAVVGKFAGSGVYGTFDVEELEDEFDWESSDNVSFDPELNMAVPAIQGVQYESDQQQSDGDSEDQNQEAASESTDAALDTLESELDALLNDTESTEPDAIETASEETMMAESMDSLVEQAFSFAESGTASIKNYAPRYGFQPGYLPFPQNRDASQYGASPDRVNEY